MLQNWLLNHCSRLIVLLTLFVFATACVPMIQPPVADAQSENSGVTEHPARQNARATAAQTLQVDADAITVVSEEAVEWPDACLGAPATDEMCGQVVTPGYLITLAVGGNEYQVHTNADGSAVRMAIDESEMGAVPDSGAATFFVESIEVLIGKSNPVQVDAVVRGQLADSCTTIVGATVEAQAQTFVVTLQANRPADQMCAQVLTPFEQIVPLELPVGATGVYEVQVGDVVQSFTLGE